MDYIQAPKLNFVKPVKKENPTNLDIYRWSTALYFAGEYEKSDSAFTVYEEKYPDQIYGYLWRASCNAAIDTTMEKGLAVPHYMKLIEVASADTLKNKKLLVSAYNYLAAYEANITKNYTASLGYYAKILAIKPDDVNAEKYVKILEELIGKSENNN